MEEKQEELLSTIRLGSRDLYHILKSKDGLWVIIRSANDSSRQIKIEPSVVPELANILRTIQA
jgi:hypothetical protein